MDNKKILYYVIKILVVLAQTSELPSTLKLSRVNRLNDLAREVWLSDD